MCQAIFINIILKLFFLGIIKNKYQYSDSTFELEVQSWFRTTKT
jgi:hypothetical protein